MDIVDAQVHVSRGKIEATLANMDALGINALMIDELWGGLGSKDPTHIQPGFELPGGGWRALSPTAQEASLLHPQRFSYLVRVDRRDPDLASVMRIVASEPAARAVRIQPVWTMAEMQAFAEGAYDELFTLVDRHALPVFVFIPGYVELLPRYLTKFREVQFIVDHAGMPFVRIPIDGSRAHPDPTYFDTVLRLAEQPNIALKWAHVQNAFGDMAHPYESALRALHRAIDAFGAERILWASDNTVIPQHSWANLLSYVRDSAALTRTEKEWILGGTARRILQWPAPANR